MSGMSFSKRIFIIILSVIVFPTFLMFYYLHYKISSFTYKEISNTLEQTFLNSEGQLYELQENMVNLSHFFYSSSDFQNIMNQEEDYYEKYIKFEEILNSLVNSNLIQNEGLKITFFDHVENIYTNYGVNFQDYTFLLEEDWVKETSKKKGYLSWSLFHPSIFPDKPDGKNYISVARNIGCGILILSMDSDVLFQILDSYKYNATDETFIISDGKSVREQKEGTYINELELTNDLSGQSGNFSKTYGGHRYQVIYYTLSTPVTGQIRADKVVACIDSEYIAQRQRVFLIQTLLFIATFGVGLLLIVYLFSEAIVKPIKQMSRQMSNYTASEKLDIDYRYQDEIGELYRSFGYMADNITGLFEKLEKEYQIKERYRFESLRAQINPHFLFNTLNSIRWMAIIRKQDNIVKSIDDLTDILQYSMNKGEETVTLKQEIDSLYTYMSIQNTRFGMNYQLMIDLDQTLMECEMIKFSMQPIVENCIIHGFRDLPDGQIVVTGRREGAILLIRVKNNGNPISHEAIKQFEQEKHIGSRNHKKVTGIGVTNVDEIIRVTYGEEYGLKMFRENDWTIVEYSLPYIIKRGE